jgi:RHS repeat-associated protein
LIDLAVDPRWLQDPRRHFPVYLDPTITIQPDTQDADFTWNQPTYSPWLGTSIPMGTDNANTWRPGIQFDLSAIPAGASVTGASLGLYYNGYCLATANPGCPNTSHTVDMHRMTAPWTTTSTTSQIAYDSTTLSSYTLAAGAPNGWMTWDATAAVKNWLSGTWPNDGLFLMRNPDNTLNLSGPYPPGMRYTADTTILPELNITYNTDGVTVNQPTTVHSNGADLSWSRYTGSLTGAAFQKYEVHRSAVKNFTPSSSTLLTTINDISVTSYRDTTAAPNATFYYAVMANSSGSNQVSVATPADGQASKTLQPATGQSQDTYMTQWAGMQACNNFGANNDMSVGTDSYGTNQTTSRALFLNGLSDIPTNSTITKATLSLFRYNAVNLAATVHAYRATRAWGEGTGVSNPASCTGNGATWYEANGGVNWTNQGGDFATGSSDTSAAVSLAANQAAGWDAYNISSIAQQWVNGGAPNLGVLLKYDTEVVQAGNEVSYWANDYTGSTSLRPKLVITYQDGSHAIAPTVTVSAPAPGATVAGTAVTLTAAASDDHYVAKVEFYVDGTLVGNSTTGSPYSIAWNSTGVANGNHSLTAKAYDDAGNTRTSAASTVSVENVAAPMTSITAPTGGTVSGTTTVTANASAAGTLTQTEFYFDNTRFATVPAVAGQTAYSASWNTLDTNQTAYDGSHVLTTVAYDQYGNQTTSTGVTVTVSNAGGSQFTAAFTGGASPQTAIYDPNATTQGTYNVTVTVQNTSSTSWSSTYLYYRWFAGNDLSADVGSGGVIAMNLRKGTTSAATSVSVSPPTLPAGVNAGQYQLRFDLYNSATATWFASKGNPPIQNPVIVNKKLKVALGLEKYYQYTGNQVGGNMQHLVNVANGNSILRWTPFTSPGRGLATVMDLTYNSLEDHSDSPAGNNFSLSISTLTRFGLPLDIHPDNNDTNTTNRWIGFTDGDGTPHKFQGNLDSNGNAYYVEPPGVHLYLRQYSTTDTTRWWALTRPDRVTYFYNQEGFPTFVSDKNGNSLAFTLYQPPTSDNPGGPKYQITKVTDAGGRAYTINYFIKATAKKPQVRGKISSIFDHSGHELDFAYYEDGNLLSITQKGGTNADGSVLADRHFVFTYTTSDGSGPAIPSASARVNPDPKTPNESTRLYSVADPNGHETTFAYVTSGQDKWKLQSFITRDGQQSSLTYDDTNFTTTLTAPLSRATKYVYDSDGKVTSTTNALNQVTGTTWTADFTVSKVTEPSTNFTQYTDDNNGYSTGKTDQLGNTSKMTFQYVAVDGNDVASHWCPSTGSVNGTVCAPRTQSHVSQLLTKTDPAGVAAGSGYQWQFSYDGNGNMVQVQDPYNNLSKNSFNADGTLASTTDANNHTTQYTVHDANGLPTTIIDATGSTATFNYDADGLMVWEQDGAHASNSGGDPHTYRTYFYYDSLHRLGRQSSPKSTAFALGTLVWSDTWFDANDNVVRQIAAHYGGQDIATGATTSISYDVMDRKTQVTNPDTTADPAGERQQFAYDAAGRMTSAKAPKGVLTTNTSNAYTTFTNYDALDRPIAHTQYTVDANGNITSTLTSLACYSAAGDMTSTTQPKAQLTTSTINCASTTLPYTTYYTYDKDHRVLTTTDADGHQQSVAYDADGNIKSQVDANGTPTTMTYDQMNRLTRTDQPFITGTNPHNVTTIIKYDAVGNKKQQIGARAFDASTDKSTFTNYVTTFNYDAMNRLTRTDLPVDGTYTQPLYVHKQYDANGRVIWTALPDTNSDPTLVPSSKKTTVQYFDTGWVYTSQDPGMPRFHFDYTAEGQQSFRAPEDSNGNLDPTHQMTWGYYPDGDLAARSDVQGQSTTYTYDADNKMTAAHQSSGITTGDQTPVDVKMSYTTLDQMAKVDQKKPADANYTFTTMTYDLNGNVTDRAESGTETPAGVQVTAGKAKHYDFDQANWLLDATDASTNPMQQITESFFPTGWERQRVVQTSNGAGGWNTKETTNWDYFANGKLDHMSTVNGSGTTMEQHTVSYVDTNSIYVDGNRTQDTFTLKGPSSTASCYSTSCTATYQYDPRNRLVNETDGHGGTTSYGLDSAGNITTKTVNGTTTTNNYNGTQLQSSTTGGVTTYYTYDPDGNLWCTGTTTGLNCALSQGAPIPSTMTSDYTYDYLDRLASYRALSGGTQTDSASYVYDALDRIVSEQETHPSQVQRTTTYTYQGIGSQLTEEQQSNSSGPITTKDYTYDAFGHRLTMTTTPTGQAATTYSYGYNVHDSVSLLLDPNGNAKSSYGYSAYGDQDTSLSQGDTDKTNPFNAFRYTGKRYDSGSGSMNMGARSFNPGTDSFLQPDIFHGALDNLGLSSDALSQNRYSLAGGNPLSFVESDGHVALADGGGGGTGSPIPTYTSQSSTSGGGGGSHKDCGILGLGCTGVGQQVGQFVQGVGDGLGDMWKGGQALGSVAMDCAQGGAAECGNRLEKMGSYVVNHPGDFFGSLIDYKDLSQGNYAKWAGHLAPSIVLTVATVGGAGALAKAGEAAGLAAEASDVAGEAGGLAAGEAAGEAGGAALEAGAGKAVQSSGEAAGDAAAGTEKAAAEAGSGANEARAAEVGETCNSFVPTTAVLLANGQHEPIDHIKVGDRVAAGDPVTGKVFSEPVDRVIIGQGAHHMVAITIPGDTILTTYNHPFWLEDEHAFVSATSLHAGNRLQLEGGQVAIIGAVSRYDQDLRVYNLSVDVVHTFFAGQRSVLVHNCGGPPNPNGRIGSPEHQAEVSNVAMDQLSKGYDVTTEFMVKTPGGLKANRFVDVASLDPQTGEPVGFFQIGRQTLGGNPIARETQAMNDLANSARGDVPMTFIPYN